MDGFSDLIIIIVLAVILLLVMEGSHRRRYRSGWYGPTYVYRPFYIFRPRPPRPMSSAHCMAYSSKSSRP